MAAESQWVVETSTETFEADVVQRSMETLVVVDFWAPWCEPCRELTPLLERLANEYAGKFVLVKVNVDECQEIAGAFGVQSIPVVAAMSEGQPVDFFQGAAPEAQVREWLSKLLPSPADELVRRGDALEAEDPAGAESAYREAQQLAPDDDSIRIRLARVILAQDRDEETRRIITELEERGFLEPEAESIKSQLELRSSAAEAGPVDDARLAAEAAPDDLSLKLKLADALAVSRRHEEALELCLEVIERDKAGLGGEAKDTMVRIFDTLGPSSELTSTYRRRLATAWY